MTGHKKEKNFQHIEAVHRKEDIIINCSQCEYATSEDCNLKKHVMMLHHVDAHNQEKNDMNNNRLSYLQRVRKTFSFSNT